jgi:excisionase family DNA binding protein
VTDPALRTLSVAEAAKATGLSPEAIRTAVHGSVLKAIRVGNRIRIPQAALADFMQRAAASGVRL